MSLILKVRKGGLNQKVVTIPKCSDINIGDKVIVEKYNGGSLENTQTAAE